MSRWQAIPFILFCLVLFSCGGGGGGGPLGIVYTTDWSHRNAAGQITGLSQKINILDSAGLPITSVILQNTTSNADSTTFNLSNGSYMLQAQLFSLANAGGTQTGEIDIPVTITNGQGTVIKTTVGDPVANISVAPTQATVQVGRGQQFRAFGLNASNITTFITPNSITWSVLGGVGTVTQDGNFTQNAIGTGSVRADYTNGHSGSAAVTGTPPVTTHTKWTVLVFLNAANSLQSESFLNMNQMERVADNPDVRFVVQWKQFPAQNAGGTFDGTRRYLVKSDQTSNIASELIQDMGTSIDMGNPTTLHDFITWGKANYPADHYCLIVWDHGSGWQRSTKYAIPRAISEDDQSGSVMEIWQMNQAFGSEHLDIVAFDACDMAMAEIAYELKDNCDYLVGSQELTPAQGYPYDTVFGPLRTNPNLTPRAFSQNFVTGMVNDPLYTTSKVTQSVIDESQMAALATSISSLGTVLQTNVGTLTSAIQTTRNAAQAYDVSSTRYYRDIKDLCLQLEANTSNPAVLTATAAVKTAVANAVVWEGHNSFDPGSNGISIDFSPATLFSSEVSDYQLLKLGQATQWDEFLTVAP